MQIDTSKLPECATVSDMVLAYNDVLALSNSFIFLGFILGVLASYWIPSIFLHFFWMLYHKMGWTYLDHRYVKIPEENLLP
jgi:hypothetical protein